MQTAGRQGLNLDESAAERFSDYRYDDNPRQHTERYSSNQLWDVIIRIIHFPFTSVFNASSAIDKTLAGLEHISKDDV